MLAIISEKNNVIGKPHVEGATVDAKIEQYGGDKVTIIKFKKEKALQKKARASIKNYTRLEILKIKDK